MRQLFRKRLIIALLGLLITGFNARANNFQIEGSDLITGIDSASIGLSGAVSASTNDTASVFWNPAGLAEIDQRQATLSRQLNGEILPINFASLAFRTEWLDSFGLKSAVAVSWIPRLHIRANGAFAENSIELMFLRFTLPGLAAFDGEIESKTKDTRITFAFMPKEDAQWSFGVNVSRVDCRTFFCGVSAKQPGQYVIESARATAYAVGIGAKYFASPDLTFGLNFKDIDTSLDLETNTQYADGTSKKGFYTVSFPRDLTLGAAWKYAPDLTLSLDYQIMYGYYSSYHMDFRILRTGVEYTKDAWAYRAGLIAPLKIQADKVGNFDEKMIAPAAPSFGLGWKGEKLSVDAAFYTQLIMSARERTFVPGLDLTVNYPF